MIIPDYHLLISTSMIGPFHYCGFWEHDKWWRHETWWHTCSLQWSSNWKPYIFVWKLWKCHSCLTPWRYSLPIFGLCSLGFWGEAIFATANNIYAKGRLAPRALVYARELRVDTICTYGFPFVHESSFSCRLIWSAYVSFIHDRLRWE
jgi:hypothetical protein